MKEHVSDTGISAANTDTPPDSAPDITTTGKPNDPLEIVREASQLRDEIFFLNRIDNLENLMTSIERRVADMEQYSRRNGLLIHCLINIPKTKNEFQFINYVITKINQILNLSFKLTNWEIDTAQLLMFYHHKEQSLL